MHFAACCVAGTFPLLPLFLDQHGESILLVLDLYKPYCFLHVHFGPDGLPVLRLLGSGMPLLVLGLQDRASFLDRLWLWPFDTICLYLSRFSDVFGPACLARMMNLNPVCKENQPYLSFFHMDEDIPIWCSIFMPEQPCKFLIPSLTKMDRSMHWWIEFIRFISSIAWVLRHLAWSCHTAKSVAAGRFGASIAKMWFVCFCCFSSKDIFE